MLDGGKPVFDPPSSEDRLSGEVRAKDSVGRLAYLIREAICAACTRHPGRTRGVREEPKTPTRVGAVRSVLVYRPAAQALRTVRDIELLQTLERKARSVVVHPTGAAAGSYHVIGRVARVVPWVGDFSYQHHDAGWHSSDLVPRRDGWSIAGGFLVTPVDDGTCRITHYEEYTLPKQLAWLRLPLVGYMRWSQMGEMRDLARLVEDSHAQPSGSLSPELVEVDQG